MAHSPYTSFDELMPRIL